MSDDVCAAPIKKTAARRVIHASLGLACGGGGPNEGETSTHFVERLTQAVFDRLSRHDLLNDRDEL